MTTGAFWIVRMENVAELFDGVYLTGRFPVGIYPTWLRLSVTFLVPIGFAITVPAEAVTSRLDWQTLLLGARLRRRARRIHPLVLALWPASNYTGASA